MALRSSMSSPFALLSQIPRRMASFPSHPPMLTTSSTLRTRKTIRCVANRTIMTDAQDSHSVARRSGNYPPSCWDYNFIMSLESNFMEEKYKKQANQLKDEVRNLIRSDMAALEKLELIDSVQRLGLKYHFNQEIKEELNLLYRENPEGPLNNYNDDHHATSLAFRLFRHHGLEVSAENFKKFKDESGNFRASLCDDVNGLLSLYEASFFGLEGETIMDEARVFAATNLKEITMDGGISQGLAKKIGHGLSLPLHWTLQRMEARWYIETCQEEENINPTLLEFAKLDFNMVQSVYQQEVIKLTKWWADTGIPKITFARDRLVEHYFWCCGMICEPQYGEFREIATKLICLITTMDDVYDVYGTVDELELVTDLVNRWDMNRIDELPHKIKTCVLAMFNNMNDIGKCFVKERGINIIPSLSKGWADLCETYLIEVKWYYGSYKPTLEEYLANGVVSIAAPLMLLSAYFMTTEKLTEEGCNSLLDKLPRIIYYSSLIIRLVDDMGTSSVELARGDNLKAVQCYMYEAGVSEEVAREYIQYLVLETWKKLNKELMTDVADYTFHEPFVSSNPDFCRTSYFYYQFGDGHGFPQHSTKDKITKLLVKPFPLHNQ